MTRIRLGDAITTRKGYAFKSNWYTDTGTPIVKVSNLTEESVDNSNLTFIPDEIAQDYRQYVLNTDDIIIQTVGSWPSNPASVVGKVIRIPSLAAGALLNQNAVIIYPDERIYKKYLYYLLKDNRFKDYIVGCAQGAASQASITLEAIRNFTFTLPPLPTQRKIAAILSAYDDLIENNTRRIQILEEIAQAIYRHWFVDYQFPGYEDVQIVDSALSAKPKGWDIVTLETVCDLVTDGAHRSPLTINGNGFPMASVKDMTPWEININTCRTISEDDYHNLVKANCKPLVGDVLIAKDGSYLKYILGFTPFGGQIVKENSDGRPRIGSVTDSPRSSAV
jgi:hypothetical protein